jgi:hypothetical protein
MQILLCLLILLVGLSILLIPFSSGFFPQVGLGPLKLGHRRSTRLVQILLLWTLAAACWRVESSAWSWIAIGLAGWFTFVAVNFFPQRIFVDLNQPDRSQEGLAAAAPVLAIEVQDEVVAYPLELIVPHHIANDVIAGSPVLVAW